jgi:hypothetical protein
MSNPTANAVALLVCHALGVSNIVELEICVVGVKLSTLLLLLVF